MKKLVLIGRSEAGKTTLTQALRGEKIHYHKTQYVNNFDVIVDTPGEYAQTKGLGHALALYTYESDVVGSGWYLPRNLIAFFHLALPVWPTVK